MLHCYETAIAVRVLSPVAIIVSISHSYKVLIDSNVSSLSLFSRNKNPKKCKSFSK
jgi:hypothetical protein